MSEVYDLPIVVLGEIIEIDSETEVETIHYDTGVTIRMPKVTKEHVEKLKKASNAEVKKLSLPDIADFLSQVGGLWMDPEYPLRKKAIEISSKITGFDECFIARDYDLIAGYTLMKPEMYDQIDTELGNYHYLDEWIPVQDTFMHADPRGKVFHVMVGNIPIASMFSVVRGILTKNMNISKLPSRDVSSFLFYIMSFAQVFPDHPVTKSLSTLYWPRGTSDIEEAIVSMSDVVCVWGGAEAVKGIKPKLGPRTEFIEFGPKRSLSIIDLDQTDDINKTACRLASDASLYNQEACFSSQLSFVKGKNVDEFIERLEFWLNVNAERWPRGFITFDNDSHISLNKLRETFSGHKVISAPGNNWCIIKCTDVNYKPTHPLGRTIYVYVIDDIMQVLPFIDREVQSVGCYPWKIGMEYKDYFADRGADRICELGLHTVPRAGFSHDSLLPLSRMVRYVCLDRPISYKGKYLNYAPEDEYMHFGYYESEEQLRKLIQERMLPGSCIPKNLKESVK